MEPAAPIVQAGKIPRGLSCPSKATAIQKGPLKIGEPLRKLHSDDSKIMRVNQSTFEVSNGQTPPLVKYSSIPKVEHEILLKPVLDGGWGAEVDKYLKQKKCFLTPCGFE